MFIQAISHGGEFEINLHRAELETTSYMTVITLDKIEVEFNVADYSQDDFKAMAQKELTKVKAGIMKNAKLQCAELDAKSTC